ncbi:Gfo/Idh/MocA family protein [Microbacterium sp.]|uniref:Gfo/Idh/MocA family protein n=1 Tax=Microbacterium sp. TaxID=51671 RepID=UPI003C7887F3
MSTADTRDVVVVGAGGMGQAWLDSIARRRDLHVSAVVDVVEQAAQASVVARGLDAAVFTDVQQALTTAPVDLVVNVTIPEAHLAVSSAAVRMGVPVLTEKPVTPTVAEALRLAALSRARGVLVATSQSRRHTRGITAFRDALRTAGGAEQLDAQFFQNPRFGGFRDRMPHPLLIDMAIHTFDQARFVLGTEPVSVYCEEFNPSWSWYDGDAAAEAVFAFADGARFSYSGSWCADGLQTSWNGDWRGSAVGGTASWDGETDVRLQSRDGDVERPPLPDADEGLDAALAEFVAALDGGSAPSGEIHRNIWSLAMVEAAVASAEQGRRVLLADIFAQARQTALLTATDDERDALADSEEPS